MRGGGHRVYSYARSDFSLDPSCGMHGGCPPLWNSLTDGQDRQAQPVDISQQGGK